MRSPGFQCFYMFYNLIGVEPNYLIHFSENTCLFSHATTWTVASISQKCSGDTGAAQPRWSWHNLTFTVDV